MKMLMWYRLDVAFKLRMAELGRMLTYEERLQRLEELVWMRDEAKSLIEEKEYEPAIQESTDESTATTELKELVRGETYKWATTKAFDGGIDTSGSGGCGESGKCEIP